MPNSEGPEPAPIAQTQLARAEPYPEPPTDPMDALQCDACQ